MKTNLQNKFMLSLLAIALLSILACNALIPVPTATPSPVPPTATSIPLGEQVILSTVLLHETNQTPASEITAEIPTLQGSTDPHVVAFNTEMTNLVHHEIDSFKENVAGIPVDPTFAASFLDVKYTPLLQEGNLLSIKFGVSFYSSGAAHPGSYSITVNYDLGQGRELALSELFLADADYLKTISTYSISDLKRQNPDIDDSFLAGAAPTPENYRSWNITPDGLLITFDEYQVAPYAAGPQRVVVPYGELQSLIDPRGPLADQLK